MISTQGRIQVSLVLLPAALGHILKQEDAGKKTFETCWQFGSEESRLCWDCRSCCQYKKVLGRSSKQDCGTEDAGENPCRTMVSHGAEVWHKMEAGCRTIIIILSAHVPYNNSLIEQGCAQRQEQVGGHKNQSNCGQACAPLEHRRALGLLKIKS